MLIGLHDADGERYPNLALMKLSAYHKQVGDSVSWFIPLLNYDKVYSSKVFTFTPESPYLPPDTVFGGTGYGLYTDLPKEIDDCYPDYSIYPNVDYAIGFLTRGCPNKCTWCVVPGKEGNIKPYRTWQEIVRPDTMILTLLDNNILACDYGIDQIKQLGKTKYKVDFNQGLDARLVTPKIGRLLGKIHWQKYIRFACDTKSQMPFVEQAHKYCLEGGVAKSNFFCYVLVRDIEDAYQRVEFLRKLGIDPFAQPYRDFENNIEPTEEQRHFARWVNHKAVFKTVKWEDYKG
jgi:hypothetical protein